MRPGIVHRIDKDTSGLLVVAKNDAAHLALSRQLEYHGIEREYHALARGGFKTESGTVDLPIGRHPVDRKKMAVIRDSSQRSREAVTHWSVLERFGRFTLVRCQLETGRTHQIRVHMSYIGHPLLGDTVYGGGGTSFEAHHKRIISGQCLCATELELTHPRTQKHEHFSVPMPKDLQSIIEILRKENEG
jgi:23S rRNA pseudouridine1911/1915/1917 synthase